MRTGKTTPKLNKNFMADTWVKAYETTLTGAATSVTISDLNGDVDEEYELKTRIVSGAAGSSYYVRPNNDSGNNYGYQRLHGTNTDVDASRQATYSGFALSSNVGIDADKISSHKIKIYAKSGYVRIAIIDDAGRISTTTVTSIGLVGCSWNNTADNITSLVIASSQTDGLGVGTYICLMKKVRRVI